MIIEPKIRGFICTTAHPSGCAQNVREQIDYVKSVPLAIDDAPKKVLVIGASTGYGLASRISAAFGMNAQTIGVFFERGADGKRTGSAGWYNSAAFEQEAKSAGLYAKSINGDAFSDEIKAKTIEMIKQDWGGDVDLVIYSLAAPMRVHPKTGEKFKSVLGTIGDAFTSKTVNVHSGEVSEVTIDPATEEQIEATKAVMGGEDWQMWMDALLDASVLADNVKTVAYSYIGPELTFPIYRNGTIGQAKEHLEATAKELNASLSSVHGQAYVSVNKALVTQASSAIPVVPLYISLLYKVMKEKAIHEGCIEQIHRLYKDFLYQDDVPVDEQGRIRIDDWEMRDDVQKEVFDLWQQTSTDTLEQLSDIVGYRAEFMRLFGFGLQGVDYQADVAPEVAVESIAETA